MGPDSGLPPSPQHTMLGMTLDGYFDLQERPMSLARVVTKGRSGPLESQVFRHDVEVLLFGARIYDTDYMDASISAFFLSYSS
jgi:hypothetical protein